MSVLYRSMNFVYTTNNELSQFPAAVFAAIAADAAADEVKVAAIEAEFADQLATQPTKYADADVYIV